MIDGVKNWVLEESILKVLGDRGDNATYVIKNWLREKYPGIKTDRVRRSLQRLAKDGVVERKANPYSDVNIQWGLKT